MQRRHYIVLLCLSWAVGCGEAVAAASSNYHPVAVDTNAGTVLMSGWAPTQGPTTWFTIPVLDGSQTWTGATNTFSGVVVVNGSALYPAAWGEGYIHDTNQAFTAAAGFEVVSNFSAVGSTGMGSLTATSLTVIASGWYQFSGNFSFDSDTAGTEVIMHAFTNGAEVVNIGFHKSFATAGDYGNAMAVGSVYLASNDTVTLRIDVDKNCTLDWDHVNCILKKIAP